MKNVRAKTTARVASLPVKERILIARNRQSIRPVNLPRLKSLTRALLEDLLGIETYDIGVYLTNAGEMTHLNETFLRHQGTTDVIAFDYSEPSQITAVCGEIFVCVEEAVRQARRFRTDWQTEVVRYIVHGLLHLLGYDDHHTRDRCEMKSAENRLLRQIARRYARRPMPGLGLGFSRKHLEPKGRHA